jgi:hypothetical protein
VRSEKGEVEFDDDEVKFPRKGGGTHHDERVLSMSRLLSDVLVLGWSLK